MKLTAALTTFIEPLEERLLLSGDAFDFYHVVADPATGRAAVPAGQRPGGGLDFSLAGSATPVGLTAARVRAAYGIEVGGAIVGDGAGQTIVIVDAYDNPAFVSSTDPGFLTSDLHLFDVAMGLPDPPSFLKLDQNGGTNYPARDTTGWAGEIALDVEWAHAIAPAANIVLIEANSAYDADLITASVNRARLLAGTSVVSMSFGRAETATDPDTMFTTPAGHGGITFVAATGDKGYPGTYPAYSPYVVAVGGTTLTLSGSTYVSETGWSGSGGGQSSYQVQPSYQNTVQSSGYRQIPDVAFDADPYSGVAVYDSYEAGAATPWVQIGGTSLSAPCWAGLIAIADGLRAAQSLGSLDGHSQTLPALYSLASSDFHDITSGSNGIPSAGLGYDEVTGRGSPRADLLVPHLAATSIAPAAIYSATMDANPNWTTQGDWAWGVPTGSAGDPTSGHTGANVVGYNLNGAYGSRISVQYATTPAINCTGKTGVTLEFWRWLVVDSPNRDDADLAISTNGSTWTSLWTNTSAVNDTAWAFQTFDISHYADNQPTLYLRWGMGPTDNHGNFAGWNLDDVLVTGSPALVASTAPTGVSLQAGSDTGVAGDGITGLNNHSAGTALSFQVAGTVPGATVRVYDGATLIGQALAPGTTTVVTTDGATALSDGAHGITARQSETGKTESPASPALAPGLTIDTVAPSGGIPVLDSGSDTGYSASDRVTQGINPLFTGTASDSGSGLWKVLVNSDDGKTATDSAAPFYGATLATLNEGSRTITATIYDLAGNSYTTGPLTVTVDRTAPTVQANINAPAATGWYNLATGPAVVTYTCGDGAGSGVIDAPVSPHSFGEGANQSLAAVTVHDAAGNASAPSAAFSGINVDLTAPTVQANINAPAATGWYNLATGPAVVTYTCGDGSGSGVIDAPVSPHSFGEGANQSLAAVTVHDAAGNASAPSAAFSGINVDLTAPVAAVNPLTTSDANPALTGAVNDPAALVWVSIAGQAGGPYLAVNHGDGTWSLPSGSLAVPLPRGVYDVNVAAADPAGNPAAPAAAQLIVYTLTGDANLDGVVDLQDFGALKNNFGTAGGWLEGDFNGDGIIDLQDFGLLKDNFGATSPLQPAPARASALTAAPASTSTHDTADDSPALEIPWLAMPVLSLALQPADAVLL